MKLARAGQRLWWLVRNPVENAARLGERRVTRRTGWRAEEAYVPERDWEQRLHDKLGAPWPCPERESAQTAFRQGLDFVASQGLAVGREAYGGWDDGDPALARAAWCVVRHLRPERVLETGVGRGITSRVVLEALKRNGTGQLWSVDQPPPLSPRLKQQVGAAIPSELRMDWRYVRGSSRGRLPALLEELGEIDLFIHDSMHSTRNVHFELSTVWPTLRPGGVMLVGDVNMNRGLEFFISGLGGGHKAHVGLSDDGDEMIGVVQKAV
jgi:Methyltransferase domain